MSLLSFNLYSVIRLAVILVNPNVLNVKMLSFILQIVCHYSKYHFPKYHSVECRDANTTVSKKRVENKVKRKVVKDLF